MAKIGNEARLILKLAQERMQGKARAYLTKYPDTAPGYNDCIREYESVLAAIIGELELKSARE